MFIDQGLSAFGFLDADNVMIFHVVLKHVEFSAKKAVVTTEKRTAILSNDSKTVFLVTQRRTRKKVLKTPLCGIDWVDDKSFENCKDSSFFEFGNHGGVPLNHRFINCS